MTFLGYFLVFFISGFAGYLLNADRGSTLGTLLMIGLPVLGVYFLGWWTLLAWAVGLVFGGRVYWEAVSKGRISRGE
jgi:hypothetical protein